MDGCCNFYTHACGFGLGIRHASNASLPCAFNSGFKQDKFVALRPYLELCVFHNVKCDLSFAARKGFQMPFIEKATDPTS